MRTLVVVVLLTAVSAVVSQQKGGEDGGERVEVELQQGRLSGLREVTEEGRVYYKFLGIPFALPPVGNLRFKDPVAMSWWAGVKDGSQHPPPCLQPSSFSIITNVTGSEDCLYLNVFTPLKPSSVLTSARLPVMVFIHGGAFVKGDIKSYDPSPLLHRDVIIVTLQYRLNIFGFLSTGDEVLPGNLGLKDQTVALRWVRDNIDQFGGDPNRVTLFGQSAGGWSVHLQVLSPHATGLFQRVILQSGLALSPGAISENPREMAFKIGSHLNCSAENSMQLLSCINEATYQDLFLAIYRTTVWRFVPNPVLPWVDGDFLPDHPAQLLKTGRFNKVDIISGFTLEDGAASALHLFLSSADFELMKSNFSHIAPLFLHIYNEESPEYLAHFVFFQYFQSLDITVKDIDSMIAIIADQFYKLNQEIAAEFHALSGQKVYQYVLEHRGQHSYSAPFNNITSTNYVAHHDDLIYLFDQLYPGTKLTRPEDLFVRRIMTDLWVNFATTGNPTVDGKLGFRWSPTDPWTAGGDNPSYLSISVTPRMKCFDSHRQNFWRNLPIKRNKILFPERFQPELHNYIPADVSQSCPGASHSSCRK